MSIIETSAIGSSHRNRLLQQAVAGALCALAAGGAAAQQPATTPPALEEIIVTAQRREENIQNVAIAVTAFDGNRLREQNIGSAFDMLGKVPGLSITSNGTQRNAEVITIRGQGQTFLAPVGVANYFAEVPLIQAGVTAIQGGMGTFFDLENLQVLRGPQGTLFGRNTTGGAVLLNPRKPGSEFAGHVQAQAGNYDDREYEAAIDLPLIEDTLMVRIAYKDVARDGYTRDVGPAAFGYSTVCQPSTEFLCGTFAPATRSPGYAGKDYDNKDYWHARIGVLWQPTEALQNYFVAYQSKARDNGTGFVFEDIGPGDNITSLAGNIGYAPLTTVFVGKLFDRTVAEAILARSLQLGPRRTALNVDQYTGVESEAYVNTTRFELGDNLSVRNILGYQTQTTNYAWDLDGTIMPVLDQWSPIGGSDVVVNGVTIGNDPFSEPGERGDISDQSLLTEELQLVGTAFDEQLDFVTGIYYSRQKPEGFQATGSFNVARYSSGGGYEIETTSKAVYAQGTLQLGMLSPGLSKWKATLGVRYTEDEIDGARYSTNFFSDRVYTAYPDTYTIPARTAKLKSDEPTWTVGLDYQMNDSVMTYGKVTHGYKAGNFIYSAVRQYTVEPEFVTNYELGMKSDFAIGEMPARVNVALFHVDYEDIQRAAGDVNSIGSFQPDGNDVDGDGNRSEVVCIGRNGENFTASTSCLDQGAIVFNADKARMTGIELEATVRPLDNLDVSLAYSYIDSEYRKFELPIAPDGIRGGTYVDSCDGPVLVPGVTGTANVADLSCIPFQNTPEHIAALNVRYTLPLDASVGEVVLLGSLNYQGEWYNGATTTPKDDPAAEQDAFHVFNASAEWNGILGSGFDLRAFVNNVSDKTYRLNSYTGRVGSQGFVTAVYGEPRMYGVSLRYRFGAQ